MILIKKYAGAGVNVDQTTHASARFGSREKIVWTIIECITQVSSSPHLHNATHELIDN